MLARRDVIKGLGMGLTTLPLATVLANPALVRAAADTVQQVESTLPNGKKVTAALAMPATLPAPAVVLIHEWWGLNDQIKAVAADFAAQGYIALAIDLMDGKVATTPDEAKAQTAAVGADTQTAIDTCTLWTDWLRSHKDSTGKVGTCGWCFGGGWSLNTSLATPIDATVIYYGRVTQSAEELAPLSGPVLGHFATKDNFINAPMVNGFIEQMGKAGKSLTVYWYEADHAFANPTSSRYDQEDAASAWDRTKGFLAQNLELKV